MNEKLLPLICAAAVVCLAGCSSPPNTPSNVVTPQKPAPVTITIVVKVANTRFGTAEPSDVKLTVTSQGQSASTTEIVGSAAGADMSLPAGTRYAVSVAPLDAYTAQLGSGCEGAAADGERCEVVVTEKSIGCDKALWDPVYTRDRLKLLKACEVGTGVVMGTEMERDGDLEIWLKPDPAYGYWLRPGNSYVRYGALVVEIPCQGPIVQQDAAGTCDKFAGKRFSVPAVGDHLLLAGPWVEDRGHASWGELHGANIAKLPR